MRNTDHIPGPNRIFGKERIEPPKEKTVSWDLGRIKWWIGQGAEPTGTVLSLLDRVSLSRLGWGGIGLMVQAGVLEQTAWKGRASIANLRKELAKEATPSLVQRLRGNTRDTKQDYLSKLEDKNWPIVQQEVPAPTDASSRPTSAS